MPRRASRESAAKTGGILSRLLQDRQRDAPHQRRPKSLPVFGKKV